MVEMSTRGADRYLSFLTQSEGKLGAQAAVFIFKHKAAAMILRKMPCDIKAEPLTAVTVVIKRDIGVI